MKPFPFVRSHMKPFPSIDLMVSPLVHRRCRRLFFPRPPSPPISTPIDPHVFSVESEDCIGDFRQSPLGLNGFMADSYDSQDFGPDLNGFVANSYDSQDLGPDLDCFVSYSYYLQDLGMDSDGYVVDLYCSSVDANINVADLFDDLDTGVDTELYGIDMSKYSPNVSLYRPMLIIAESAEVDLPFYGPIPPREEKRSDELNAFIHECCCIWCPPLRRVMKRSQLINDMENLVKCVFEIDLAQHHPYTKALKTFGSRAPENKKDVQVEIHRDWKILTVSQLEKQYNDWLSEMHDRYDEEIDGGLTSPLLTLFLQL